MRGNAKTTAEERYAAIQKKDLSVLKIIQSEAQIRRDKSAKLRELRLAKEAQDAAGKLALQGQRTKAAPKKPRLPRSE